MEIFGLVIIVILVAVGLVFALFVLTKPKSSEVQRVKESVLAANFLNTVLQTSAVGCGKRSVRDLLHSCALVQEWGDSLQCENGKNACEFARDIISVALDNSVKEWGKDYEFFIEGSPSVERIRFSSGDCSGEREGFTRPEKVRPGFDISVTLWICR